MVDEGGQVKVLAVGPPCGRIKELFAKVTAINAKYGPFSVLLVLGDLFSPYEQGNSLPQEEEDLLDGRIQSPIPIYFTLPPSSLHPTIHNRLVSSGKLDVSVEEQEGDLEPIRLTDSLFFLRKQGVSQIPSDSAGKARLRVTVLGGRWEPQHWMESDGKDEGFIEGIMNPFMTAASVGSLRKHPSLRQSISSQPTHNLSDGEPTTLAAARAQMARAAELAAQQAERASRPPIDILLTNVWPNGVTMFSDPNKLPHHTSRVWGSPVVAQVVRDAQPRYHFALAPGSIGRQDDEREPYGIVGLDGTEEGTSLRRTGVFWEREPFRSEDVADPSCNVTRFISLARFANEKKERWFMALNLTPAESVAKGTVSSKIPANTTSSPFSVSNTARTESIKRKALDDGMESGQNFRWTENKRSNKQQRTGANGLPNRPNVPMPDRPARVVHAVAPQDCWFCLSNPQCAKHLIVAIGTECYIAMPKGQLPPTSNPLSPVPGGGHVLIIPIEHVPSLLGHPDVETVKPINVEMESWRSALRKVYASFDAVMVAWEVCRTKGTRAGHMQCQAVPVPREMAKGLHTFFRQAAEKNGYAFTYDADEVKRSLKISDEEEERRQRSDYVRLDIDDQTWFMPLEDGVRFNLQFPRETLSMYLGIPDRADWKRCARSEAIESAETTAFKTAFEPYAKALTE